MADAVLMWRRLVGAQVRSQLQYRGSFALDLSGSFLISFLDFFAVLIVFHNVDRLGSWNVHEVALLYAISMVSFALTDLVIGHLDLLPQKVRDGTFDVLLVRPRSTLLQVAALDFQLRRLGKALQGVIVLVYALAHLHVAWTAGRVVMLVLTIPTGVVLFSAVWVAGVCIVFWTVDGGEFTNAFTYGGNFLTEYPIDIYSRWTRRILAYVVPLAFVAYFPCLYILDKPDPLGLPDFLQFSGPVVAALAWIAAVSLWGLAMRRYRSAGG
ncbi:MAG TPA: ABC-2 family transporter protein [Gaiellaceae bacterium]|nr:ABC-2 family transporter protein [Gaiellaceae bacterium]